MWIVPREDSSFSVQYHDFADILLLDNVTGPLLTECMCTSVNNYVSSYIYKQYLCL